MSHGRGDACPVFIYLDTKPQALTSDEKDIARIQQPYSGLTNSTQRLLSIWFLPVRPPQLRRLETL